MNTIGLTFCLLLLSISQQSTVDKKYNQAFRYIQTAQATRAFCREIAEIDDSFVCKTRLDSHGDSLICITVSDSIVSLSNLFFFDKIIEYELKNRALNIRSLKDSLYMADLQIDFSPFFLPSLRELPAYEQGRLILFFSKPHGNRLTAELLPFDGSKKNFSNIKEYNRALQFLFYFSPQNRIEKVFSVQFQYD